jgi:DNA excision repair protein ERCC-2
MTESACMGMLRYFQQSAGSEALLPAGVYTLHDLRTYGRQKKWCPYFLARHMLAYCNVLVYNYQYLLDPKVAGLVSKSLERECIVVFDEAHNIDNVCIEALSVNLRQQTLDSAGRNLTRLGQLVDTAKQADARRLTAEYRRLVEGVAAQGLIDEGGQRALLGEDQGLANPLIAADVLNEAVPGNIRRGEHFLAFLKRFLEYLQLRLNTNQVRVRVWRAVDSAGYDARSSMSG